MPRVTRRDFAGIFVLGTVGSALTVALRASQSGLDKFTVAAPPCKDDLTPSVPAGPEYKTGAPVRTNLREAGVPGTKMTLSGFVTGLTCGRIKNTRVEFWHADSTGKYDMAGFRLRGAVLTDAEGHYSFETIMPGQQPGHARRIHARIAPAGKPVLTTVLFFPGDSAASKEKGFKPSLVMKKGAAEDSYTFDFLLDA